MLQLREIRIHDLSITDLGEYQKQYNRPYATHAGGAVLNQIYEKIDYNKKIDAATFAGIANQFVTPSGAVVGEANIVNGWSTRRLRWVMKVETISTQGVTGMQVLTGYTDHQGITVNSKIDPAMVFHINNSLQFSQRQIPTPTGIQAVWVPVSTSQVLANNNYGSANDMFASTLIRPQDVIQYMGVDPSLLNNPNEPLAIAEVTLTNEARKSRRSNSNPASYMSTIVEAFRGAHMNQAAYGQSDADVVEHARRDTMDSSIYNDPFINILTNQQGTGIPSNRFSIGDLLRLNPDLESRIKYYQQGQVVRTSQLPLEGMHGLSTQVWHGQDMLTHIASVLSVAIPAIVIECGLGSITFTSDNMVPTMQRGARGFLTQYLGSTGIVDGEHAQMARACLDRIEQELMVDLSNQNTLGLRVLVQSSFNGDTRMQITVENETADFMSPTFGDASFAPVHAGNTNNAQHVAMEFDSLIQNAFNQTQTQKLLGDGDNQGLFGRPVLI